MGRESVHLGVGKLPFEVLCKHLSYHNKPVALLVSCEKYSASLAQWKVFSSSLVPY